jgi:hypothetical protein
MTLKTMVWDHGTTLSLEQIATNIKNVVVAAGWTAGEITTGGGVIGTNSSYAHCWFDRDLSNGVYADEVVRSYLYLFYYNGQTWLRLDARDTYGKTADYSDWNRSCSIPYQIPGSLMVSAGDKHIWLGWKTSAGVWTGYRNMVCGCDRYAYDTMDLLSVDAPLAGSSRFWSFNTSTLKFYMVIVGGEINKYSQTYVAPTGGVSDHVRKIVLKPISASNVGPDPVRLSQTVQYRFGNFSGVKGLLAEGVGGLYTTASGMQLPNTTNPEWMVFYPGLAIQWDFPTVVAV